jgi:hypothetical protein
MAPAHRVVLACIIQERFCCQLQASLVKHISSFDYTQDGEPAEPYLANKDVIHALSVLRSLASRRSRGPCIGGEAGFMLHEIRFTGMCIQAISRQTVMNNAGYEARPSYVPLLVFPTTAPLYFTTMSIRKGGGEWIPMLLPSEGRQCAVCKDGLYRDTTMLRGGWSRCTICDEFVHYGCLASGKVSFLKARPRVCKSCRAIQEGTVVTAPIDKNDIPAAVGS